MLGWWPLVELLHGHGTKTVTTGQLSQRTSKRSGIRKRRRAIVRNRRLRWLKDIVKRDENLH